MTARRRRLMAGELLHTAWPSPFPMLLVIVAILISRTALTAEPPHLTRTQKKIVRKFEKELTTRFNSEDNPGDRDTWYVIVFTDTALGTRQSRSLSGNYLTITRELQVRGNSAAKMTQGRNNVAMLLVQYYYAGNSAAGKLRPTVRGTTDWARVAGAKRWQYRAFVEEEEAQEFFNRVDPK